MSTRCACRGGTTEKTFQPLVCSAPMIRARARPCQIRDAESESIHSSMRLSMSPAANPVEASRRSASAVAPSVRTISAGSTPSGRARCLGFAHSAASRQNARWADCQPAESGSVAMTTRLGSSSNYGFSCVACDSVKAVPRGAMPTYSPSDAIVTAMASIGPSTRTGVNPAARSEDPSASPYNCSPLMNTFVPRVLRYSTTGLSAGPTLMWLSSRPHQGVRHDRPPHVGPICQHVTRDAHSSSGRSVDA
jgi:hypothetical protein